MSLGLTFLISINGDKFQEFITVTFNVAEALLCFVYSLRLENRSEILS